MALPVEVPDVLMKPWEQRERIKPLRTYSGRIVYDKRIHPFSLKDVERISNKILDKPRTQKESEDFLTRLLRLIWKAISLVVPLPGFIRIFEPDFENWFVGVVSDSIQVGDFQRMVRDRSKTLILSIIRNFGETVDQFFKE